MKFKRPEYSQKVNIKKYLIFRMESVNLSLKQLANKERVELELRKNKITMQVLSNPQIQLLEQVCTEIPEFPTALEHVADKLPKLFKDGLDSDSDSEEEISDNDRVDILVIKYIELGLIALGTKKIPVKKPLSEYQKYYLVRRPEIKKEKPGLKNTEYMRLVVEEWQALLKKDDEISPLKSPLSEYQKFQQVRRPEIMKEKPGLKNTQYTGLVAEEWQALKANNLRSMQKEAENNKKVADEEWSLEKIKENLTEVTFEEFIKNKAYQPDKNQSDEENKKYVRLVYDRKWTMLTDKINPEFVMKPITEPFIEVAKSSTPINNRPDCSMESVRIQSPIDFSTITKSCITNLNLEDPYVIEQCQIKPISLLGKMTYKEVRIELMKNTISTAILSHQYYKLFKQFQVIKLKEELNREIKTSPIDFFTITKDNITKLDFEDPCIIEQCQIKPILLTEKMTSDEFKKELIKNSITTVILNYQHNKLFELFKQTISELEKDIVDKKIINIAKPLTMDFPKNLVDQMKSNGISKIEIKSTSIEVEYTNL